MKTFWFGFVVTLIAITGVACAQTPNSSLAGTYKMVVSKEQAAAAGWTGDLICENSGTIQLVLAPAGSTTLTQSPLEGCPQPTMPVLVGTWAVAGDQFTYHEITDTGCGDPTVVYKWKLEGSTLTLNKVSDTCQFSASDMAPKVWTKTN